MTRDNLIYLAGIIDGEGTISVTVAQGRKEYARPFVQVANTNYKLSDWVQQNVDIKYGFYEYNRHPETQKPSFLYQWRGTAGADLIRRVRPFLVLKGEQADLVMELWEGEGKWNQGKRGKWCSHNPLPQDVIEKRISICNKLRELNKKGPIKVTSA